MPLYRYRQHTPNIHPDTYIAPSADIIGQVQLAAKVSIWFNATLRADIAPITIGEGTNIQDNSVLHTDVDLPITIGKNVTVGHLVMLHGCTIEDEALIGMGSKILNGAVVGRGSFVAAGALIKENQVIPPNTLVVGIPAKEMRTLTPEDKARMRFGTLDYQTEVEIYKKEVEPLEPF